MDNISERQADKMRIETFLLMRCHQVKYDRKELFSFEVRTRNEELFFIEELKQTDFPHS